MSVERVALFSGIGNAGARWVVVLASIYSTLDPKKPVGRKAMNSSSSK